MKSCSLKFAVAAAILLCACVCVLSAASPYKVGWAFSGGGSRVVQEAALMKALLYGLTPSGQKIRPDTVSGASAGSISAVALNAILKTMDGKSPVPFTMDMYEQFLVTMNNSVVFQPVGISVIQNVIAGFLLDNTPLRKTLSKQLDLMGFRVMSDLYIPTCISVVESGTGLTFRVCSDDPASANVPIIDAIMASTAMPVVFQMASIANFNPPLVNNSNLYVDGCSGTDMIPLIPHLTRWNVSVVYAITKQNEIGTRNGLPGWVQSVPILANAIAMTEDFFQALFLLAIEAAKSLKTPVYQVTPDLDMIFSTLDFNQGPLQWDLTTKWAHANDPTLLNPPELALKRLQLKQLEDKYQQQSL